MRIKIIVKIEEKSNEAIKVQVPVGDPTTGTGTAKMYVYYKTVTL